MRLVSITLDKYFKLNIQVKMASVAFVTDAFVYIKACSIHSIIYRIHKASITNI